MKSASLRPAILRVLNGNDCHSSSAVIFKEKYAVCPANSFLSSDFSLAATTILRCLDRDQPYTFYDDLASQFKELQCSIVPPGGKKEVPVSLKFIFHSKAIRSSFERLLSKSPSIKLSKDDTLSADQRALLLSSFLVFQFTENPNPDTFSESHAPPGGDKDFWVIATPYGNSLMQGSAFKCRVANVINGVLFLIDQPLSKGCEGGLLLSPLSDPLGMILTTSFESKNENLNLTFAGDLREIMQGLRNSGEAIKDELNLLSLPVDSSSKFVVLLESGRNSYGTGTLIRVEKRRLILTCSHVVTDTRDNFCTWKGRRYPIRLIYKNPIFDRPFDVAVFEAPVKIPSSAFCTSSSSNPILGSTIKSIGFPVFDPVAVKDLNIQPSVYRGKLVNYRAGMIITDSVIQSGQSGGPIFNERDQMVGIVVSNFRENATGRVFPSLNCSVPMFNINPYLSEYCDKNDVKCLKKLEGNSYLQRLWNFEEPVLRAKM